MRLRASPVSRGHGIVRRGELIWYELADGRHLPHVYSTKPVRLCLFDPQTAEWSPGAAIADTIVPWTYEWLFYFEEWLVSDEWKGGGRHPEVRDAS